MFFVIRVRINQDVVLTTKLAFEASNYCWMVGLNWVFKWLEKKGASIYQETMVFFFDFWWFILIGIHDLLPVSWSVRSRSTRRSLNWQKECFQSSNVDGLWWVYYMVFRATKVLANLNMVDGDWNMFYDFPDIGNFITPTDELHHFQRGSNHQPVNRTVMITRWSTWSTWLISARVLYTCPQGISRL